MVKNDGVTTSPPPPPPCVDFHRELGLNLVCLDMEKTYTLTRAIRLPLDTCKLP